MRANDVRSTEATSHGAYVCVTVPASARPIVVDTPVWELADRLGLRSEFAAGDEQSSESIAFLRRVNATPADIADDGLLGADAVVHVASDTASPVDEFCAKLTRLLDSAIRSRVLAGVVRPMNYTGTAMHNFSYAHRVLQQPGSVMPNAFLVPTRKTTEWWQKDWMERHTYFLPRYDGAGRMVNEGHVLAAATGIAYLMRRTYKNATEPAAATEYDFLNYFECANEDVSAFHDVCVALRDVARNPEWRFVREGPTWQGRRVATWAELFA